MKILVKVINKLYWLGGIGVIGGFLDQPILKWFLLFFLIGILDFILSLIIVLRTETDNEMVNSLKFLFQNLGILFGIPVIYLRNLFRLPNPSNYKSKLPYSLPFDGLWIVANGGITKETSHSWNICSQRYAYDFYIQENGRTFRNNGKKLNDYLCYGEPVLAAVNGTVVEIQDLFEDTPIGESGEAICSASDVRGNYIIIQHSKREYSMTAHIKRGSFCVKEGEKVRRGQQIACCGNSGNTSEPHIHFQVQQGKSFLLSASLPIKFERIKNHTTKENSDIRRGDLVENFI